MSDERFSSNNPVEHIEEETLNELLHDLLPEPERARTLSHLQQCIVCDRRFRSFAGLVEASQAMTTPGTAPTHAASSAAAVQRLSPRRSWWVAGVAAAAVIVLALWHPWQQKRDDLEFWVPAGRELVEVRSGVPAVEREALNRAVQAYDARRLDTALELLQDVRAEGSLLTFRNIYLASALTLSGRGRDALTVLETVPLQRLPMPWRDEAGWIRYVALVQAGREADSRQQLDQLAERPGAIGDRARARRRELSGTSP